MNFMKFAIFLSLTGSLLVSHVRRNVRETDVMVSSAPYAMALLQVHQAKALKQLHEGGADPGVMQELHTVTDLALRAMEMSMYTLVVQESHLWLTLANMKETDKHRF